MYSFKPLAVLQLAALAWAGTVTYDWNIGWVKAAPDGVSRPVIGINGRWPCPPIEINVGDRVIVNIKNNLGNETTAIHWHGLFQKGSNQMDGPAMVTQCPIAPGNSFTHNFVVDQPGTFWYHAHVGGQYIDGLRGPIIVHDRRSPHVSLYDDEITMTVSDWYHDQAPNLINYFQSPLNMQRGGSEPVPNATLINEAQNVKFNIRPGGRYLFHIINMGAFAAQYVNFEEHELWVVEIDGVYTVPKKVNQVFLTAAQRYSVVVIGKKGNDAKKNFAITTSMNLDMFDPGVIPPGLNNNATAWLVYDNSKPFPPSQGFAYDPAAQDDTVFTPFDQQPALGPVTHPITLTLAIGPGSQGQNRASFNGISYVPQKVPTLYTALSAPADKVANPLIYGVNSNAMILPYGAIVELTVINTDGGPHPFHLHSHNFQVIGRSGPSLDESTPLPVAAYAPPKAPMRRDVVIVYAGGNVVLRWKVDNPGVTLFHCHIEWHVEAGLTATFIEAPKELQAQNLKIPENHLETCKALNISTKGNAAGNTNDWLDLTGAFTEPPLDNWGALIEVIKQDPHRRKPHSRDWSRARRALAYV
ncbi:Cupredoxin [Tricladium varicosporioides]|nr:Cupredoxin [Hymenoscyphus varicosporioides]